MAQNKLPDLNNHLFAQLERLSDEDITDQKLDVEIQRANAIKGIAQQIINSAKVTVSALKLVSDGNFNKNELPENLGLNTKRN